MRRAPLVLAGTAIGLGLLLTYRTPPLGTTSAAAATPTTGTHSNSTSGGSSNGGSSSGGSGGSGSSGGSGGGTGTTGSGSGSTGASGSATGQSVFNGYGNVQVKVTVSGGQITNISAVQLPNGDPRSAQISSYAAPTLVQQAMAAQSANINGVSGATYTSQAFAQSLQSALSQLGM
jgi:uncharacterized protein with FMN-binding domain